MYSLYLFLSIATTYCNSVHVFESLQMIQSSCGY